MPVIAPQPPSRVAQPRALPAPAYVPGKLIAKPATLFEDPANRAVGDGTTGTITLSRDVDAGEKLFLCMSAKGKIADSTTFSVTDSAGSGYTYEKLNAFGNGVETMLAVVNVPAGGIPKGRVFTFTWDVTTTRWIGNAFSVAGLRTDTAKASGTGTSLAATPQMTNTALPGFVDLFVVGFFTQASNAVNANSSKPDARFLEVFDQSDAAGVHQYVETGTLRDSQIITLAPASNSGTSFSGLQGQWLIDTGVVSLQNPITTEPDSALAIKPLRIKVTGLATETDSALAVKPLRVKVTGLPTEVDTVPASTRVIITSLPAEVDTALAGATTQTPVVVITPPVAVVATQPSYTVWVKEQFPGTPHRPRGLPNRRTW